ncbi:DUF1801 domain-containing protein [Jejudonia soesokkakensis]|uniref:DUF1801 domain-containing protein n=1 Tax=Jejudonia soesokkakensis TaxID=1323432 RepID=A0ABW2MUE2_9FLAO
MKPAEEYILKQPEPFKSMLLEVQVIIESTLPDPELLYKWSLPIYYSKGCPICYLNVTKGYLDVCFWARKNFNIHMDLLISENRKFVKSLRYYKPEDIDAQILIECLEEANRTKTKGFTAG